MAFRWPSDGFSMVFTTPIFVLVYINSIFKCEIILKKLGKEKKAVASKFYQLNTKTTGGAMAHRRRSPFNIPDGKIGDYIAKHRRGTPYIAGKPIRTTIEQTPALKKIKNTFGF